MSTARPQRLSSSDGLRLYTGEPPRPAGPGELSRRMTLTEFYERWVLPSCRADNAAATIRQDRLSLAKWRRITGDPPLEEITREICLEFVAKLRAETTRGKPTSPNTIRKDCVHLQYMLDRSGPGNRREIDGAGLLESDEVPYLKRPRKRYKEPLDNFSLDEIWRWLEACRHARPASNLGGIDAQAWHRALLVFEYNTALRIGTVMQLRRDMLVDWQGGKWLLIPPEIYKGGLRGGRFYVNRHAMVAIDSIAGKDPKLFPWRGWPESQGWLQACRREIFERAGIKRPGVGFHGLRKTTITWLAERNAMIAKIVAGHRSGDVTRDSYVDPRIVAKLLEELPQPTAAIQKQLF